MVNRQDLPLMLASPRFGSPDESEPLDRIRMQKGVFLLEERGPNDWRNLYPFSAYDWGPYSRALTSDLQTMVGHNLLDTETVPGRRYSTYRTTTVGEDLVERAVANLGSEQREFVAKVRHFVTTRSFNRLLRDVYAAFPAYAVASRFSD